MYININRSSICLFIDEYCELRFRTRLRCSALLYREHVNIVFLNSCKFRYKCESFSHRRTNSQLASCVGSLLHHGESGQGTMQLGMFASNLPLDQQQQRSRDRADPMGDGIDVHDDSQSILGWRMPEAARNASGESVITKSSCCSKGVTVREPRRQRAFARVIFISHKID